MKKLLALLLALAMVLSLAACGKSASSTSDSASSAPANSGPMNVAPAVENEVPTSSMDKVRYGVQLSTSTLQPFLAVGIVHPIIMYGVYENLFSYTKDMSDIEPRIAKSYTTEDNLTYDIELFDYVTDSQGNKITADDVLFSFETMRASGTATDLNKVVSFEKTGDYSLRLVLNSTVVSTFTNVMRSFVVVSQKAYEASGDGFASAPVGTGPYAVTDFQPAVSVTLTRRPDYWQTDDSQRAFMASANLEEVTLVTIAEGSQLAVAMQTGTVDAVTIPQTAGEQFLNNPDYAFYPLTAPLGFQIYCSGDAHSPLADNVKLRQAIFRAMDTNAIIAVAYGGYGEKQYTMGPATCSDFQEAWKNEDYYDYNLEEAKKLLEEAGYKPGELKLQMLIINLEAWSKTAQVIQQNLSQIGIDLEIINADSALYVSYFNDAANYDLLLHNMTQLELATIWEMRFNMNNYGGKTANGFTDEKLQQLLEACIDESNHTPENVNAFHQYLKEQAYSRGLCAAQNFNFTKKEVGMVEPWYDRIGNLILPCCTFA